MKTSYIFIGFGALLLVGIAMFMVLSRPPEGATSSSALSSESQSSQETESKTKNTTYTLAEVQEHATRSDCWTIINNKVYDITDYISSHPGGNEILRACGIDGTRLFTERTTDSGEVIDGGGSHSANATRQLQNYYIGELAQ